MQFFLSTKWWQTLLSYETVYFENYFIVVKSYHFFLKKKNENQNKKEIANTSRKQKDKSTNPWWVQGHVSQWWGIVKHPAEPKINPISIKWTEKNLRLVSLINQWIQCQKEIIIWQWNIYLATYHGGFQLSKRNERSTWITWLICMNETQSWSISPFIYLTQGFWSLFSLKLNRRRSTSNWNLSTKCFRETKRGEKWKGVEMD